MNEFFSRPTPESLAFDRLSLAIADLSGAVRDLREVLVKLENPLMTMTPPSNLQQAIQPSTPYLIPQFSRSL